MRHIGGVPGVLRNRELELAEILAPFPLQEFRALYASGQMQLASARACPGGATTGKLDASPFSSTVSARLAPVERRLPGYTARQV